MADAVGKMRVLFICTHNSARSQMAEGFLRSMYGGRYEAYSAGVKPTRINPYAIDVMREAGVDLSKQRSKSVDEFRGMKFDYVITVCDDARETCPFFPTAKKYAHKSFENPAEPMADREDITESFRHVRDEIRGWVRNTFKEETHLQYP